MENNFQSGTQRARGFAQRLKEDGRQTIEQRKRSAADRVEGIAQALERTGAQFGDNEPTLAEYANRLASTVGNLATRLRDGSIEELIDDTRMFARRNPGLFIVGGVAVGFALARFVKASAHRPLEFSDDKLGDDAPTLSEDEVVNVAKEGMATSQPSTLNPGSGSGSLGASGMSSGQSTSMGSGQSTSVGGGQSTTGSPNLSGAPGTTGGPGPGTGPGGV